MINAPRDDNYVRAMIAVSNGDGVTILPLQADPATHSLKTSDGMTGSDLSNRSSAVRDGNMEPIAMAVSSSDGITPVELYIDSSSNSLLVKST